MRDDTHAKMQSILLLKAFHKTRKCYHAHYELYIRLATNKQRFSLYNVFLDLKTMNLGKKRCNIPPQHSLWSELMGV